MIFYYSYIVNRQTVLCDTLHGGGREGCPATYHIGTPEEIQRTAEILFSRFS